MLAGGPAPRLQPATVNTPWAPTVLRCPSRTCHAVCMAVTVQPVSEALFDDVQMIFGTRGQAARCQCQGFRMDWHARHSDAVDFRRELLRDQISEGYGLVAHLDGQPVGWCSMAPRSDYARLRQTTWQGRAEDRGDSAIWAATCFVIRAGFRRLGVSRALVAGTVDLGRERGAVAVEAYPMQPAPGRGRDVGRAARRRAQCVSRRRIPHRAHTVAATLDRSLRLLTPNPISSRVPTGVTAEPSGRGRQRRTAAAGDVPFGKRTPGGCSRTAVASPVRCTRRRRLLSRRR